MLAHTGGLVCLTGGRDGFPTRLLSERKIVQAENLLATLKGAFPERLYVQLTYGGHPGDLVRARKLRDFARDQGVPIVSAPEVRYATPDLHPLYDTLVCSRLSITVRDPHPSRPQNDLLAVPDPCAWERLPQHPLPFPEGIENAEAIVRACDLELLAELGRPVHDVQGEQVLAGFAVDDLSARIASMGASEGNSRDLRGAWGSSWGAGTA